MPSGVAFRSHNESVDNALAVTNIGDDSFSWTGGLHPYFLVHDLLTSSLSGLQALGVEDRYDPSVKCQAQDPLEWSAQLFERLYDASPPLILSTGRSSILLSSGGFDQWMVWNSGKSGAAALTDLPSGDWRRFVCVEPVRVSRPVTLAPGETFEGKLLIEEAGAGSLGRANR
jgi:glucose-6-phosphate 1-epimerase